MAASQARPGNSPSNKFWTFTNRVEQDGKNVLELTMYGDISSTSWWGDEITPAQFDADLKAAGDVDVIEVHLNSGGGDVFAAQTIGTRLKANRARTKCFIEGFAGSAATIIASYCDEVYIANGATYMMHLPAMGGFGYYNEPDLLDMVEALRKITDGIVAVYAGKTGKTDEEIRQLMEPPTWYNAQEAVDNKFANALMFDFSVGVEATDTGRVFVNHVAMPFTLDELPETIVKNSLRAPAAEDFCNISQPKKGNEQMEQITTIDGLRAAYPALVGQIENAAAEQATAKERQRIRDIEALDVPGAETIVNAAKFEAPKTAAETAVAIVAAAKQGGKNWLAAREDDVYNSNAAQVPSDGKQPHAEDGFGAILRGLFPANQ